MPAKSVAGSATNASRGRNEFHRGFRELDDLVLHLKGLVLVRKLRERNGADAAELDMYRAEIERVRERLADYAKQSNTPQAAA
jgi:hypothetical protein